MPVAEQRWKQWFAFVVMPGARGVVDIARVPREIAQYEFCRRRLGDFCGFNRTQIPWLRPGPVRSSAHMPHADAIEPKGHVVAYSVSVPARLYIHIVGVTMVCGAMENIQTVGHVLVQR